MANNYDVIVIGGGPAGMMAAGVAAKKSKSVLLLEKNDRLGRKLRITGKGRCNVTNIADAETFFENFSKNEKFMYSSFYSFDNYAVMDFFETEGVPLKTERGGRVFPVSDKAADIVDAMINFVVSNGVIVKNEKVIDITINNGTVAGVVTEKNNYIANSVIVATGGKSYPLTGSTGDGYKFAIKSGHTVTDIKPSLVPVNIVESYCKELQGLSLKNVGLKLFINDKLSYSDMGEMLFAHFGVTGPIVLSASAHINSPNSYFLIDLKPALNEDVLDKRVLRDFNKYINKQFANSLGDLLPKKLIPVIVKLSGIEETKKVNEITKEERKKLVHLLKNLKLSVKSLRSIDEAIITSGGVSVSELSPSTMESKIVKGLYFCGEVIDVDAYTGGYNLQIAFSTGYAAGKSAAE